MKLSYVATFVAVSALISNNTFAQIIDERGDGRAQEISTSLTPDSNEAGHQTPLSTLINKANNGSSNAQFELGKSYYLGRNSAPVDKPSALFWFELAGQQGHPQGQLFAGLIHYKNQDLQGQTRAKYWFEQAANQGLPLAQFYMGQIASNKNHDDPDHHIAYLWFKKASEKGLSAAQYNLGLMYYQAKGVSRDIEQSGYWLDLACTGRFVRACEALDDLEEKITYDLIKPIEDEKSDEY